MSRYIKKLPPLETLIAFESVGRHGSFTQAATELYLTQSAVSKQIRQLEDSLKIQLFERKPRGVVLTPAGKNYIRPHNRSLKNYSIKSLSYRKTINQTASLFSQHTHLLNFGYFPNWLNFIKLIQILRYMSMQLIQWMNPVSSSTISAFYMVRDIGHHYTANA
jgi:DNA-binding MarR family transcriptional regulator